MSGDVAAVAQDQGLTFLDSSGNSRFAPISGVVGTLASDGRNFLVGTSSQGVKVISPHNDSQTQLGTGRAAVREVRPGKVVLLFWDGSILDSDANTLGQITWGNPRDAAMVQGRLAVLVTRPDRDPVVGLLEGKDWQPLEIPGLAEIGAEKIATTSEFLFAAGPRGVIRARLPLTKSTPPQPNWSWTTALEGNEVRLASSTFDHVGVTTRSFDLAPAPATFLRLRSQNGSWETLRPGADFQLPVGWGQTPVTLQAERNGLVTENSFTIVRPWPWWLRWWAWPLHALALGGVVFGLVRLRTRQLQRRNLELETHVNERTEQLRKASAVKEEFLASISHEIRNPLNGVVGICAMLADRDVGPREKILVRTLGGCADQLRSMLDDILDFSRIERGQVTLTQVDFETNALVEEAARAMDPELTACALILPDQSAWLHGDSGKLRQIVCNLISNALKYGVPREAGVEVRLIPAGGGRSRLRLAVRNSGPTIPPTELTRLFESFQRGPNTGNIPGSGLGLAVCRRLAQAMGGRITAASRDGITEFALELTLANAQPPAPAPGLPATVSRALAIEDEDYNRMALGHVLRALGYTVDWAADGASALKLASTHQYDLVLTDWRLPDTDGGELCRQLVKILPRPTPPIVAVTAYSTQEKLEEARAAGMTGFVTKPVTKEKLERVIRGLSEGLRPKRSLDIHTIAGAANPLASLSDIAPTAEQLAANIARKWQSVATMAQLHDPRSATEAHALRSLLLLAGEETAAEQVSLLEQSADTADWAAVARLLPFAAEEIEATQVRLKA
ncbi:MAG: response regulator [Opitutaceae bacterium]|nr:response regulator [Opitutaceae bacterium]